MLSQNVFSSHQKSKDPDITDSPPFSPVSFTIERQQLAPRIELELRHACAQILQDAGDDFDAVANHRELLRKYAAELEQYKQYDEARARKEEAFSARKARRDPERPDASSYKHRPSNAATSFEATASQRKPSISRKRDSETFEPLAPTHTTLSGSNAHESQRPRTSEALGEIRATLDLRPKTSAAACIDYNGPSAGTSGSTSRTNTTYDGMRTNTGLSSLALTPGDEKRTSYYNQRVSEQILRDGDAASQADAQAKTIMAQQLARRRASSNSIRPQSRSSLPQSRQEPERPQSRAGSIREGIKDYIRPRASMDSMRSYRSETSSRPVSRQSNKGGSWWRGASAGLKRKGSWSSFRSNRQEEEEHATSSKDRGLDLNRSLPPLPGLDQYVEKKSAPLHIANLMRAGPPTIAKVNQRPTVIDDDGLERTLSESQERQRSLELRRLVEEKMRIGAISPSNKSSPDHHPIMQVNSHRLSESGISAMPALPSTEQSRERKPITQVAVLEVSKTPEKKNGLKHRFSRLLRKDKNAGLHGRAGKMVTAN